jgi:uncharacterized protein (TIGR02646 family)
MKPKLKQVSFSKCWYCESKEIRADKAVDHFRPKSAVFESPSHKGYWWLAFDWRNFRYSCQYCNEYRIDAVSGATGGKATRFPLFDERGRQTVPGSLSSERPLLLDPVVRNDVKLLTFYADGMARPRESNKRLRNYRRAKISIELYNLNQSDLQDLRRVLFHQVTERVQDGDVYYSEHSGGSTSAKTGFTRVVKELHEMIDQKSSYSMAARAALKSYKKRPWIRDILASK